MPAWLVQKLTLVVTQAKAVSLEGPHHAAQYGQHAQNSNHIAHHDSYPLFLCTILRHRVEAVNGDTHHSFFCF